VDMWPMIVGALASGVGSIMQGKSAEKASEANAAAQATNVWGPQQGFLGDIFRGAQGIYGQQQGAGQLGAMSQQGAGAFANLAAGPANPYLQGMTANAMQQVTDQFNSQIMPGLLGGANAAGQLGGERYALLQNQAAQAGARALGGVAQDIYGQAWDSGMQGQLGALSAMPGAMNAIGGAPWQALQNYAGIIGRPVLGSGTSFGAGGSFGGGAGGAGGAGALSPFDSFMQSIYGPAGGVGGGGQRGFAEMPQTGLNYGGLAEFGGVDRSSGVEGLAGLLGGLW
ncbi:MAG: hypothetical protein ACRC1H_12785, partial [Caldilineaceae bacterium]